MDVLILFQQRDASYLTITNILFGVVVLAIVIYMCAIIFIEVRRQRIERKLTVDTKVDLKDLLTRLGVTMQDGGQKVNGTENKKEK